MYTRLAKRYNKASETMDKHLENRTEYTAGANATDLQRRGMAGRIYNKQNYNKRIAKYKAENRFDAYNRNDGISKAGNFKKYKAIRGQYVGQSWKQFL